VQSAAAFEQAKELAERLEDKTTQAAIEKALSELSEQVVRSGAEKSVSFNDDSTA
jgi:hypothetical protein